MIKPGYTLYATFADGEWFVKQAKSPAQFVRLCVEDQKAHGYTVPPRGRHWYKPDVFYDTRREFWCEMGSGALWRKHLPEAARKHR